MADRVCARTHSGPIDDDWRGLPGSWQRSSCSLGATYAFDRRATLGLRFTSTKNLDDGVRF